MQKKKILIADDEDNIRLLVATTLQSDEIEILEADCGRTALETTVRERPDLVVLDWSMPGMSGPEVVEALRRLPQFASVPVVMLTAMGQAKDRERARVIGVDEYLIKPFSPLQLLRVVQQRLAAEKKGGCDGGNEPARKFVARAV